MKRALYYDSYNDSDNEDDSNRPVSKRAKHDSYEPKTPSPTQTSISSPSCSAPAVEPQKHEYVVSAFTKLRQARPRQRDDDSLKRAKHDLLFEYTNATSDAIEHEYPSKFWLLDATKLIYTFEFWLATQRVGDWVERVKAQRRTDLACPLYTGSQYLGAGRILTSFNIPHPVKSTDRKDTIRKPTRSVTLNYGLAALLVENKITNEQKLGYINKGWHLSHLCGNWKCLKTEHFHVEPAKVNQERKACHSKRMACGHRPKCLVENVIRSEADELNDSSQQTMDSYTTSQS